MYLLIFISALMNLSEIIKHVSPYYNEIGVIFTIVGTLFTIITAVPILVDFMRKLSNRTSTPTTPKDAEIPVDNNSEEIKKKTANQNIPGHYNPSTLPEYSERLKQFVSKNRSEELKEALTYLEKHKILLISGVGGVGKTTLARALVDFRPINVPEPFWFSFYDNQDAKLDDILEELAAYMRAPEIAAFKSERRKPGKNNVDKFTDVLNDRSEIWLFFDDLNIVLENTKFNDKGIELLFSSLRYRTHNAKIIITSRVLPNFRNGESLIDVVEEEKQHLNGLRTDFAVDYLAKNGLDSLMLDELKILAKDVDGHPLALKLLVGLVKKFGVSDTLNDLTRYKDLKESTIKKTRKLFDKLAGNEKELLERISVYRQAETMDAIEIMFIDKAFIDAADNLIDKSLLETDHKGNYWLHPLVQEFAYDDLEDKKGAHKLAVEYYLSLHRPQKPVKKEDVQHLIEAHHHACMAEEYDQAFDIIFDNNLYELLDLWGNYTLLIDLYSKLLPEDHFGNQTLLKDKGNHNGILGTLGSTYRTLGDAKKAIDYHEQALKIAREMGDRQREGALLGNLGNVYSDLDDVKKAIDYYEQALKVAREIGDRQGEGILLGNMGNGYCHLRDAKKAIDYCEQALKVAREIGDRQGEGIWLGNLGVAYRALGDVKKAREYHEQALSMARDIGDRQGEGNQLGNMGLAYSDLDDVKKAIDYYEQALKIAREIGDMRHEEACLGNLGVAYRNLRDAKKAIDYYEQALKIAREIGGRQREGALLGNLGNAYSDLDDVKKAIEYYEQALKVAREIDDPEIIDFCERNLEELKNSKR